jgi:outer membrane protein
MKRILFATISAIGLLFSSAYAADMKIAIVDYMTIYTQAPQGQKTLEELKSKLQPQVEGLQSQQQDLMKDMQALEKNKPTLTKSEYDKQRGELEQKGQSFQMQVQQLRQQEMQNEQGLAQAFQQTLNGAIQQVGKSGDYTMILNSQAAPYVNPQDKSIINVTEQVLAIMEK